MAEKAPNSRDPDGLRLWRFDASAVDDLDGQCERPAAVKAEIRGFAPKRTIVGAFLNWL